jgi:hypothetical protein
MWRDLILKIIFLAENEKGWGKIKITIVSSLCCSYAA